MVDRGATKVWEAWNGVPADGEVVSPQRDGLAAERAAGDGPARHPRVRRHT
ncbi:hypothetical protein [Amycolatopsis sp. Hca4]|uniref:hypothetical protein n=1 Tax=Amycolatopsis sp. Hca4 TaxID=2742131 RepID=UPI001592338A|nr:hypothetical protein [Amycolatopsis sp. Hca4]QKV79963.1 hypothetical protein HUT10_43800 [Amycolatopsis sp. Hca4]